MKHIITSKSIIMILWWWFAGDSFSQSSNFDVGAYKQFLSAHQNLTTQQLYELHPAGYFNSKAQIPASEILYLDSIYQKYLLTEHEKSLLQGHNFMVSERLSYNSFGHALLDIWHKDLPVFISTDAILHALHMSYDKILMEVERCILIQQLDSLLNLLHSALPVLDSTYLANPSIKQMLKDVDVYLTIPRKLLDNSASPFYSDNNQTINELLALIASEQPADYRLFATVLRTIDFSQFKVRGHYTNTDFPELAKYFKAMIWLGRTELYLIAPQSVYEPPIPIEDIGRQIIDAELILEAARTSNAFPVLEEMNSIIEFFIGESDNVTLPNFEQITSAMNITSAEQLLDTMKVKEFQDTLRIKSFAFQRILSQILTADDLSPDSITPASAFMLLGQRFIIDSYITGQVVYDRIKFNEDKIRRMLPSTLDVLFSLGNDASAQLLKDELDQYKYGSNLAALRYLVDHYDIDFWRSSLFNLWLNTIRSLNPPGSRDSLPAFMRTAAWWQEKMNTQLASWAQLRHDNLLYAKQSYTGGTICSFPYSYVEPYPQFYDAVKNFAEVARQKFENMVFPDPFYKNLIVNYFAHLGKVSDTLSSIAQKELSMATLSSEERSFLRKMLSKEEICGIQYLGWYPQLFYLDGSSGEQLLKKDFVVADIHTAPTDASGYPIGWVLHAGTGKINLGVFIAQLPDNQTVAFVGPVMSYHEYLTTNFLRLSDEEWNASYLLNSTRPSFVNSYLADSLGNELPPGLNLFTSVEDKPSQQLPKTVVLHQSYPNPFNSSTIINFSIPHTQSNSSTELAIFNIQGQLIKKLLKHTLPGGNYMTKWDGRDEDGKQVNSGIYFYRLKVGSTILSGKMGLIK